MLRCRADVNLSFRRSMPPLFGAAHTGRLEVVQKLLAERADVNATTSYDDTTAILQTSLHGHADVVAELLAARADVNVRRSDPGIMDCGATALLLAAKRGHSETVKLLLRGRCDVNASNVNAEGALYCMGQLPTIVLIPCSYCWRQGPIFTKDVNMGRYPLPYMLQPKGISRRLLNCWCLLELI